jgi:hypothetical protein
MHDEHDNEEYNAISIPVKPAVIIPGCPVGYTDLLRDHLFEKSKKEMAELKENGGKKNPLRPSSAGKCERELAYELMEFSGQAFYDKEPLDPETQLIFGLGHSIESHLLYQFKQVELVRVAYQQQSLLFFKIDSTNPKLSTYIEGSTDAAFMSEEHGWKVLIDVKSKKVKHSNHFKDSWDELAEKFNNMTSIIKIPDSHDAWYVENLPVFLKDLNDPFMAANFYQLNLYVLSDFFKAKGFDHAALLYYDKNSSRLREIRFKPSQEVFDMVENRFKNATKAAEVGDVTLAKQEFTPGNIKCAFCSYKKDCWKDLDTMKAFFKTLPNKAWPKKAEELGSEFANSLSDFHALTDMSNAKAALEEELMKVMYANKIYKVQLEFQGPIYELKVLKNSMYLKRSKL